MGIQSIASASAAGFAAIGSGGSFAVRKKIKFCLLDLPVAERHLGIIEPAFLVFFYRCAGSARNRKDSDQYEYFHCM
jgi:hypothetical protein